MATKRKSNDIAVQLESLAVEMKTTATEGQTVGIVMLSAESLACKATSLIVDAANSSALPPDMPILGMVRLFGLADLDKATPNRLLGFWRGPVLAWLRSLRPGMFNHQSASFDFPEMTAEALALLENSRKVWLKNKGKLTSAHKKQLKRLDIAIGAALVASPHLGKIGKYNAAAALAHAREQTRYWSDAIRAAADVVRCQASAKLLPPIMLKIVSAHRTGKKGKALAEAVHLTESNVGRYCNEYGYQRKTGRFTKSWPNIPNITQC
jgi:hypothetical protein